MALGDIFQIIDKQSYKSQQVLNMYCYKETLAGTDGAGGLLDAWIAHPLADIANMQSTGLLHVAIDVVNLSDPTDFASAIYGTPIPGAVSGENLAPFYAYTFLFSRPTRLIRNGSKRIGGVPESASTDGVSLTSGFAALATTAAAALAASVVSVGATVWHPAILHRVRPGHPTVTADVITNVGFSHFGTQNTRKIGRGR